PEREPFQGNTGARHSVPRREDRCGATRAKSRFDQVSTRDFGGVRFHNELDPPLYRTAPNCVPPLGAFEARPDARPKQSTYLPPHGAHAIECRRWARARARCGGGSTNMKVLVVGAGIAGLGVATYLSKRGHDVHVLEASPRVGGRAVT